MESGGYVATGKVCEVYPHNMHIHGLVFVRIIMGVLWALSVGMLVIGCATGYSRDVDTLHRGPPSLIYMLFCILSGLLFLVLDSSLCKNNRLSKR